jgi:hypothetical protein
MPCSRGSFAAWYRSGDKGPCSQTGDGGGLQLQSQQEHTRRKNYGLDRLVVPVEESDSASRLALIPETPPDGRILLV